MSFLLAQAQVSPWQLILAALTAFVAANMNATSGGGTFLTYPMLLGIGETSVVANATSTVGLWPGLVSVLPGLKKELVEETRHIKVFFFPVVIGAMVGSYLLSHTSNHVFGFVAPVLIFIGALLLQFNKQLIAMLEKVNLGTETRRLVVVGISVFFIGIYSAYFGAGIGILFLGFLGLLGIQKFANYLALKNILAMLGNTFATLYFVTIGLVHWPIAVAMACGSIVGGMTGSKLVHVVNKDLMRKFIVLYGFIISIVLFVLKIS